MVLFVRQVILLSNIGGGYVFVSFVIQICKLVNIVLSVVPTK